MHRDRDQKGKKGRMPTLADVARMHALGRPTRRGNRPRTREEALVDARLRRAKEEFEYHRGTERAAEAREKARLEAAGVGHLWDQMRVVIRHPQEMCLHPRGTDPWAVLTEMVDQILAAAPGGSEALRRLFYEWLPLGLPSTDRPSGSPWGPPPPGGDGWAVFEARCRAGAAVRERERGGVSGEES